MRCCWAALFTTKAPLSRREEEINALHRDRKRSLHWLVGVHKIHRRAPISLIPPYSDNSERWLHFSGCMFPDGIEIGEETQRKIEGSSNSSRSSLKCVGLQCEALRGVGILMTLQHDWSIRCSHHVLASGVKRSVEWEYG